MRVYISSTSDDLERHRAAVLEVVREIGLEPVVRDPAARRGLSRVEACRRQVAAADRLLAIVGWRQGEVPGPELGGKGGRSWPEWEVASAFDRGLPVTVLMAGDSWPESLREMDSVARSAVRDFRGELDRLAVRFDAEPADFDRPGGAPIDNFRELVRRQLTEARRGGRQTLHLSPSETSVRRFPSAGTPASAESFRGLRPRRWPPPELPARPYPVLLPYRHPDLMAGRERELAELRQLLTLPVPIIGLYAASGAGKSSLLAAGLVPRLRAEGWSVAFDRHPCEAGLAGRLLRDLLEKADDEQALEIADDDVAGRGPTGRGPAAFVDRMLATRQLASESDSRSGASSATFRSGASGATSRSRASGAPVLVLDQFEDLLRRTGERRARAVVGSLLAASVQRQPGLDGPPCRWLLAYRQEYHGEVFQWLADVLRDARAEGFESASTLPHDLSGPERFQGWPLPPLGTPAPGSADRAGEAARVFLAAIEKPLGVIMPDGGGQTERYPWRFAGDGAARLARAFGEARAARPGAPLAPELQVVLAHLLELAGEPSDGELAVVSVPEEPGELIDQALEQHLRRAIDAAFPADPTRRRTRQADALTAGARAAGPRIARTRALLALRELADVQGRRDQGLPVESLARAIGPEGRRVLERLATPETRLVVLEQQAGGWCYVLSHDRMAELLVHLVDGEGAYSGFGVDAELLALRRFVKLKTELFAAGEAEQATEVPAGHFKGIEENAVALLWGEDSERWWQACRARARAERWRSLLRRAVAALAVTAMIFGVWRWTDRRARRAALFEEVAVGEPEVAFQAADRLLVEWQAEPEELRVALRQRDKPFDLLERGIGGVAGGEGREDAVLRLAELALPLVLDDAPEDPVRIASLVWALDFFAPKGERTRSLRDLVLEPLRRERPPPPLPDAAVPPEGDKWGVPPEGDKWGNAAWADIPAGTFEMGSGPGEGRDGENKLDERPRHKVTLSAFRMGTHKVTNTEFRRLYPEHAEGRDDRLPAVSMTWYQAYTYAAWLGGRLPTEAEAEYARRAGCEFAYCKRDGSEARLDEVAWWVGNSTDPETGDPALRPLGQLEPNPWGLFDVYGNVWEACADWYGAYRAEDQVDPPGPTNSDSDYRIGRGGSVFEPADWVAASARGVVTIGSIYRSRGLRVVLVTAD